VNIKNIEKLLTPLTNLAVLIGVVFLVIELRQNQEAMELDRKIALLDSAQIDFMSFSEQRGKVINDPKIAELYLAGAAGKELSETSKFRFTYLCLDLYWAAILMNERATALNRPIHAAATIQWVQSTLQRKGMRSCWNDVKKTFLFWGYNDFVDAVDSTVLESPD
jgi:hypothetical protein